MSHPLINPRARIDDFVKNASTYLKLYHFLEKGVIHFRGSYEGKTIGWSYAESRYYTEPFSWIKESAGRELAYFILKEHPMQGVPWSTKKTIKGDYWVPSDVGWGFVPLEADFYWQKIKLSDYGNWFFLREFASTEQLDFDSTFDLGMRIIEDKSCVEKSRGPVKYHKWSKGNYHKRIQKKWNKIHGFKQVVSGVNWKEAPDGIHVHPSLYEWVHHNLIGDQYEDQATDSTNFDASWFTSPPR